MKQNNKIILYRIILFLAFLALWEVSSRRGFIDSFYFSSPSLIVQQFIKNISDMSLLYHCGITLIESFFSFILIIFLSILIAAIFWFIPVLGNIFEPFLIVLNSLPKSALAPLILVWLGTGVKPIILCGISVGIFGSILHFYEAFCQTEPERIKLIKILGGNRLQIFTKVVFPGNIPIVVSMSKVNIGLALVGVIIGEFLAGKQGLGYLIIYASQTFKMTLMIMSICILCISSTFLIFFVNKINNIIEEKFFGKK